MSDTEKALQWILDFLEYEIMNRDTYEDTCGTGDMTSQERTEIYGEMNNQIDMLKSIKMALQNQINNEWLPVSERMPEFDQNCLVTTDSGEIRTSKFYGYGEECQGFREYPEGVWEINQCDLDVIAWIPLPKRYEGA